MEHHLATVPDFRSPASTGQTLAYDAFRGKVSLVLLFLPDLTSPAGLVTLSELDALHRDFGDQRCQVLGVVKETPRAVRTFTDSAGLTIPILADAGGGMIRAFGFADGNGRSRPALVVADRDGVVAHQSQPPAHDGAEILALVRRLDDPGNEPSRLRA